MKEAKAQRELFKQIHQYNLSLKLMELIRDGLSRKTVDACFKAAREQASKENDREHRAAGDS
mgnify:CR=1 FL=1